MSRVPRPKVRSNSPHMEDIGLDLFFAILTDMHDCLFCKIVRKEIPSSTVYETEHTLAFLDIHPVNPGHVLVIPKNHSQNIFDIQSSDWAQVAESVRVVAITVEKAMLADGVNVMMNNRASAGQVIDHPHVHIIPRFKGDGLTQWGHRDYKDGEIEVVKQKIKKLF